MISPSRTGLASATTASQSRSMGDHSHEPLPISLVIPLPRAELGSDPAISPTALHLHSAPTLHLSASVSHAKPLHPRPCVGTMPRHSACSSLGHPLGLTIPNSRRVPRARYSEISKEISPTRKGNLVELITETSPIQKEFNKSMAVAYINRTGNYSQDVRNSWCFYDEDKDFANLMLDSGIEMNEAAIAVVVEKSGGRLHYYSKGIEVKIVVPRKIKDSMYFLVCLSHTSDESCDTLCQLAFQCQRQFLGFSMLVKKRCFVCHKKTTLMCTQCKSACFCSRECQTKGWISHKKLCKKIKNSKIATEEEAETLNLLEEYE